MQKRVELFFLIVLTIVIFITAVANGASLTPGNIDSCGELDTADSEYALNESISSSGACFTIEASNITLDGKGFTVSYASGSGKIGVKINDNLLNITVKNMIITKTGNAGSTNFGIEIGANTNNSLIHNNTVITNGTSTNYGIYLNNFASNNTITLNNVTAGGTSNNYAVYLITNSRSNIVNSNIVKSGGSGNFNIAIQLSNSTRNTIKFNNITTGGGTANSGINLQLDSNFNNIESNIIVTDGTNNNNGINLQTGSKSNNITSNNMNTSGSTNSHGLSITTITSSDNIFTSNLFGNLAGYSLNLATAGIEGTLLRNQSILNYSFAGAGSLISIENTTFGKLDFTSKVTGNGSDLYGRITSAIVFGNNSIFINSSSNLGLNKSANVTLYSIGSRGYSNPAIFKNDVACNDCSNFTSLESDTVIFNVTSWSNYSIGEGPVTSVVSTTVEETVVTTPSDTSFPSFRPSAIQLNKGYTKVMVENWAIHFSIDGERHTFKVHAISEYHIKISLSSKIQHATIQIGQEEEFYFSPNNYILVKLNAIDTGWWKNQADITLKVINKEINKENNNGNNMTSITENNKQLNEGKDIQKNIVDLNPTPNGSDVLGIKKNISLLEISTGEKYVKEKSNWIWSLILRISAIFSK